MALYMLLHAAAKGLTVLLHTGSSDELRSVAALMGMLASALAGMALPMLEDVGGVCAKPQYVDGVYAG